MNLQTANSNASILVAGIGNIFLGDDAFGVEVVRALLKRPLPDQVLVRDFGISSYDLAYALTEAYATAILLDAVMRGEAPPGTTYLIQPELEHLPPLASGAGDAHTMNPVVVLQMAKAFGALPPNLYLVGCEPAVLDCENGALGLSPAVQAAVPQAVALVESLLARLLDSETKTNAGLAPA